jgi:hypothetical protein
MDTVDAELTRLIERRSNKETDPDELEPGYMESVRRYNARIEDENRALWCSYHMAQARRLRENLEALIAEHEAKATLLRGEA